MTARVLIKQKPGVKPKLSTDQQNEIINSDKKAYDLAHQYKVSVDTIYKVIKDNKKRKMIQIVPISDALIDNDSELEDCIFCGMETLHWIADESINRPCCPMCSVKYNMDQIASAEFNY